MRTGQDRTQWDGKGWDRIGQKNAIPVPISTAIYFAGVLF